MSEESDQTIFHSSSQSRTLYVILQGEFVFYHDTDPYADPNKRLRILAPDLFDHVYLGGPWLSETRIPRRPLYLKNAIGDSTLPEQCSELFLRVGTPAELHTEDSRVNIFAPLPIAILPGRMEDTNSVSIKVITNNKKVTFPRVPPDPTVIPILVYKWYAGDDVPCLSDDDGNIWDAGGNDYLAIHLYATSTGVECKKHVQCAFKKAAEILGICAEIDYCENEIGKPILPEAPPGLSWAEVNLFLSQRHGFTPEQLMQAEPLYTAHHIEPESPSSGNCGPVTHGGG